MRGVSDHVSRTCNSYSEKEEQSFLCIFRLSFFNRLIQVLFLQMLGNPATFDSAEVLLEDLLSSREGVLSLREASPMWYRAPPPASASPVLQMLDEAAAQRSPVLPATTSGMRAVPPQPHLPHRHTTTATTATTSAAVTSPPDISSSQNQQSSPTTSSSTAFSHRGSVDMRASSPSQVGSSSSSSSSRVRDADSRGQPYAPSSSSSSSSSTGGSTGHGPGGDSSSTSATVRTVDRRSQGGIPAQTSSCNLVSTANPYYSRRQLAQVRLVDSLHMRHLSVLTRLLSLLLFERDDRHACEDTLSMMQICGTNHTKLMERRRRGREDNLGGSGDDEEELHIKKEKRKEEKRKKRLKRKGLIPSSSSRESSSSPSGEEEEEEVTSSRVSRSGSHRHCRARRRKSGGPSYVFADYLRPVYPLTQRKLSTLLQGAFRRRSNKGMNRNPSANVSSRPWFHEDSLTDLELEEEEEESSPTRVIEILSSGDDGETKVDREREGVFSREEDSSRSAPSVALHTTTQERRRPQQTSNLGVKRRKPRDAEEDNPAHRQGNPNATLLLERNRKPSFPSRREKKISRTREEKEEDNEAEQEDGSSGRVEQLKGSSHEDDEASSSSSTRTEADSSREGSSSHRKVSYSTSTAGEYRTSDDEDEDASSSSSLLSSSSSSDGLASSDRERIRRGYNSGRDERRGLQHRRHRQRRLSSRDSSSLLTENNEGSPVSGVSLSSEGEQADHSALGLSSEERRRTCRGQHGQRRPLPCLAGSSGRMRRRSKLKREVHWAERGRIREEEEDEAGHVGREDSSPAAWLRQRYTGSSSLLMLNRQLFFNIHGQSVEQLTRELDGAGGTTRGRGKGGRCCSLSGTRLFHNPGCEVCLVGNQIAVLESPDLLERFIDLLRLQVSMMARPYAGSGRTKIDDRRVKRMTA